MRASLRAIRRCGSAITEYAVSRIPDDARYVLFLIKLIFALCLVINRHIYNRATCACGDGGCEG